MVRTDGSEIDLRSKASADVKAGVRFNNVVSWCVCNYIHTLLCISLVQEVFCLETPGGGGFGDPNLDEEASPPITKMSANRQCSKMLQESS